MINKFDTLMALMDRVNLRLRADDAANVIAFVADNFCPDIAKPIADGFEFRKVSADELRGYPEEMIGYLCVTHVCRMGIKDFEYENIRYLPALNRYGGYIKPLMFSRA